MAQQPSTSNQNATQRIYKGYKVARKVLIGIQYENVFRSDQRQSSCYTCLPQSSSAAQTALKVTPGTPPKDQRLLTIATPKPSPAHTHTCKQKQKLRNSTIIHKTANKTELELFYALQRSRGHKEHLKRS